MFLTVHGPAGALIGAFAPDPVSAFALGVLSHAVLDVIPHGDRSLGPQCAGPTCTHREEVRFMSRLAALDGVIMCGVLAWALAPWRGFPALPILAGIVGGVLPDILQGLHKVVPRVRWLDWCARVHDYFHNRIVRCDPPFRIGIIVQTAALAFIVSAYRML